jgi:hypothetical protein
MPSGAAKKAIVYRFDREALSGFLDSAAPISGQFVELLSPEGNLQQLPLETIKLLSFVRDWTDPKPWLRPSYTVRPRQQGLWVRLLFRDGDTVEATMPNNLLLFDPVAFVVVPPELAPGVHKVVVPRAALESFEVLGVIGSPLKKPAAKSKTPSGQLKMFE